MKLVYRILEFLDMWMRRNLTMNGRLTQWLFLCVIWVLLVFLLYQFKSTALEVTMNHFRYIDKGLLHNNSMDLNVSVEEDLDPLIDKSTFSKKELIEDIQKQIPNLPLKYWFGHGGMINLTCARYVNMFILFINHRSISATGLEFLFITTVV